MNRLFDESCRSLLSVLESQYVNTRTLDDCLTEYKLLVLNLGKENIAFVEPSKDIVQINRLIGIPVATYNTDICSVNVRFLDDTTVQLLCPNHFKLCDIRPVLAKNLPFDAKDIFLGFSQEIEGEVIFLDEKISLEKLCGKSKSLDTTMLVKFYMPDVLLLDNPLSRHWLYLQLRRDLSGSDRLWLPAHDRIQAAAYAALAENVERGFPLVDSNKLTALVGWRVVEQHGPSKAESLIRMELAKLDPDMAKVVAELEFCKIVQNNENYGKRYYRIYAHKDFEVQLSSLYVSLSIFGITIEEASPTISADLPPTVILHSFSWRQVVRFSFAWHRLTITIKQNHGNLPYDTKQKSGNLVLHYYIRKKAIGNYLLQLAADLNQFQMSLLQTYRIDRIAFPRASGVTFETYKSATLPRSGDVDYAEKFSSTMPRKCPSGTIDGSGRASGHGSPIMAFGSCGRASAPPPNTNTLLSSSSTTVNYPEQVCDQNESQPQIGLEGILTSNRWRMSLNDFRLRQLVSGSKPDGHKSIRSLAGNFEKAYTAEIHLHSDIPDENIQSVNHSQATYPYMQPNNDEVIYDCAASLVPQDKVVQGLPPPEYNAQLYRVVLQRDAGGSIGFTLSLDPVTRHLVVRKITPGGAAEKSGAINIGDRLVQIGDYNLNGKDYEDCVSLLRSISFPVKLTFEKPPPMTANTIGSASSSIDFEEEENGTEAFDTLSYSHQAAEGFVPEEGSVQYNGSSEPGVYNGQVIPGNPNGKTLQTPVEKRLGDTLGRMFASVRGDGMFGVADGDGFVDENELKISEDVVHEEMTYPTGATFYAGNIPSIVDENPYAQPGDEIDENLIEKMLDALGENEDDVADGGKPVDPSTFQIDVTKLAAVDGFGFKTCFSRIGNKKCCVVTHVDNAQAEYSGLAVDDVIVSINSIPVDEYDDSSIENIFLYEDRLQLTILAYTGNFMPQQLPAEDDTVCYDLRLPNNTANAMPPQLPTVSEIIKVSVMKQPTEELGCSLFACGSEIFIGHVTAGSKLDGKVESGDNVLLINNESVFGLPSQKVVDALRTATGQVTLTLSRKKSSNENGRQQPSVEETKSNSQAKEVIFALGKQLSPALRADLRRVNAIWRNRDLDDHDVEFTRLSSEAYADIVDPNSRPSQSDDLDTRWLCLNSSTYVISWLPNQRSVGDFWQMIVDCDIEIVVVLENSPFFSSSSSSKVDRGDAFYPTEIDEVLRITLPSSAASIRLLSTSPAAPSGSNGGEAAKNGLVVSKLRLSLSGDEKCVFLLHCSLPYTGPGRDFTPVLDALMLPFALRRASISSSPLLVCTGGFSQSPAFDQRGCFCTASSLLNALFTSRSLSITASSVAESAAHLRRQHPALLCCVEQLALIYEIMVASIERLVAEDALSY